MTQGIPRRIIQIWGQGEDNLTPFGKAAVANAKLLNPDFEYLFFDDYRINTFIIKYFPEYRKMFDSFRFRIQRYDFFRYLAIYHFGGFYFDIDVFLYKGLTDLLDYNCVFTFERIGINKYIKKQFNMHWDIANYAFGASPGHPFIQAIIENCIKAQKDPEWANIMLKAIPWMFRKDEYVICTTGPGIVTRTYAENQDLRSKVKILIPGNIYDKKNWSQFGNYGIHFSGFEKQVDWRKKKNIFYRKIWNYWRSKTYNKNIKLAQRDKKALMPSI